MIPLKDNVPTKRLPIVTYSIIALNIGIYIWQALTQTTEAQLEQLVILGCDRAQGFLFATPGSARAMEDRVLRPTCRETITVGE